MNNFYTQLEIQQNSEGVRGAIPTIYDDVDSAYAKHYSVLAAAAVSELPYHGSFIIRSDGLLIEGKVYDRRTAAVASAESEA